MTDLTPEKRKNRSFYVTDVERDELLKFLKGLRNPVVNRLYDCFDYRKAVGKEESE